MISLTRKAAQVHITLCVAAVIGANFRRDGLGGDPASMPRGHRRRGTASKPSLLRRMSGQEANLEKHELVSTLLQHKAEKSSLCPGDDDESETAESESHNHDEETDDDKNNDTHHTSGPIHVHGGCTVEQKPHACDGGDGKKECDDCTTGKISGCDDSENDMDDGAKGKCKDGACRPLFDLAMESVEKDKAVCGTKYHAGKSPGCFFEDISEGCKEKKNCETCTLPKGISMKTANCTLGDSTVSIVGDKMPTRRGKCDGDGFCRPILDLAVKALGADKKGACGDYESGLHCKKEGVPSDRHYAVWYDQQDPVSMKYTYTGCGKPHNEKDSANPLHQKKKGDKCKTGFAMGGKHEISKHEKSGTKTEEQTWEPMPKPFGVPGKCNDEETCVPSDGCEFEREQ